MSEPDIIQEVFYPYPPERVWSALTNPSAMARWLLPNDFAPRQGHRFTLRAPAEDGWPASVACEVLEVEQPRRLVFSWQDGPHRPVTRVAITLSRALGGTLLRLEHSGFASGGQRQVSRRLHRRWRQRLPRLFQLQVDAAALTEELFVYVTEPRAATRNRLPVVDELLSIRGVGVPVELLESMVLDGVDERQDVVDLVTGFLDRPGVVSLPA